MVSIGLRATLPKYRTIKHCRDIREVEIMGNSESSPDEPYETFTRQLDMHENYLVDTGHQTRSSEHAQSSTHTAYRHHHPTHSGASINANNTKKPHPSSISDNFNSLKEVIDALRDAGLESSNLILGIDFTKSNEWTGKYSFNRRSLHAIHTSQNPYEQAISIIGRTLSSFDEDNLIPCFGFGDGPTSFAPVIDAAIDIVEKSNFQYHVLVIIADGQVTRSPDTPHGRFSPQEQETINSIVAASEYPLSIILIGVGDGPWDAMQGFDDNIPQRAFDNFQFVNFTKITSEETDEAKKESAFALAALMEIPFQYRATLTLQYKDKHNAGRRRQPLPPPREVIDHDNAIKSRQESKKLEPIESGPSTEQVCPICLTNPKDMAFGCGHLAKSHVLENFRRAGIVVSRYLRAPCAGIL
ncbi:E3 ubiquitin-protein ligase RGLG3-like isoform X4 [Primulina huaijiensis]|uniref:E3 ubiquitin-protein ligase RGLG3-like isoform X4 n=1 Tax=Primulina huaijiensis TaxID=1492673 RepID=UPI003CC750D5